MGDKRKSPDKSSGVFGNNLGVPDRTPKVLRKTSLHDIVEYLEFMEHLLLCYPVHLLRPDHAHKSATTIIMPYPTFFAQYRQQD